MYRMPSKKNFHEKQPPQRVRDLIDIFGNYQAVLEAYPNMAKYFRELQAADKYGNTRAHLEKAITMPDADVPAPGMPPMGEAPRGTKRPAPEQEPAPEQSPYQMSNTLYPITRGENPLFVMDNKDVLAVGNPAGKDLKHTFTPERVRAINKRERKIFEEEGLDNIDSKDFYEGGVAHKKRSKKRHTSRKTNKRRSSKKQKSRRNKKSKSKHTK